VLQDFQDDGVVYIELRTTPRAMPAAGLSKDDYVKTILDILNAHNENASNAMRAFLILSVDRRNTLAEAHEVVDLAIKYKSSSVVAVDLCGDPTKGDVRIFADAFARARTAGLKITLHFAETKLSGSDEELSTLLSWKPDRLGHVIYVKEEYRNIIEKENIGVELCLSCNVQARMIMGTYSDHHFGMWRQSSVPIALSVRFLVGTASYEMLMSSRRTTSGFSVVLYPGSTILQHSTLDLLATISRYCVSEQLIQYSTDPTRCCVSKHCLLSGMAGGLELWLKNVTTGMSRRFRELWSKFDDNTSIIPPAVQS
jgi:hypothetical protein